MPDPAATLSDALARFGLSRFRPGQQEVVEAVLAGKDCLTIMPTGGGKSLCYQLPAVMLPGVTLVISPLIALMKDQVDSLTRLGIPATCINSTLSPDEQTIRLQEVAVGKYSLVYVAPERLRSPRFADALLQCKVALLAVDEAHCVSQWGHDFRPDYARISGFRRRIGNPQTMALTATATPHVRTDVMALLNLRDPQVFITGFARPNLAFEVVSCSFGKNKKKTFVDLVEELDGSGIVYASTRKRCDEAAELLQHITPKKRVGIYHAGLEPDARRRVQDEFMSGKCEVIVATNAFGMGIDKQDLRYVIHYNIPGSVEAYYQEAGRAGRDGNPARCILLFAAQDRMIQEFFIENNNPSPEVIRSVYEFLVTRPEDPIELTQEQIKEELGLSTGHEAVGACLQILDKSGAVERLESRQNLASVKLASDVPTMVELLPATAKNQRKVMRGVEQIVGPRRHERIWFSPRQLAELTELEWPAVQRALRELCSLETFDYVPPFRGRAIHLLSREKKFRDLDIDFPALEKRRAAEYDKLDRMEAYAASHHCRQWEILRYFGDPQAAECDNCDICRRNSKRKKPKEKRPEPQLETSFAQGIFDPPRDEGSTDETAEPALVSRAEAPAPVIGRSSSVAPAAIEAARAKSERPTGEDNCRAELAGKSNHAGEARTADDEARVLTFIRMALAGVARAGGRFGKTVVAQMLGGSKSARMGKWRLDQLSTFGLLRQLKIDEIADLLDALIQANLVKQEDIDKFRPVLQLTPRGQNVMRQTETLDEPLRISPQLRSKLESMIPMKPIGEAPREKPVAAARASIAAPVTASSPSPAPVTVAPPAPVAPLESPPLPSNGVRPEFYWTWRMLSAGYSVGECAEIRRLPRAEILEHALAAIDAQHPLEVARLLDPARVAELKSFLAENGTITIPDLVERLPAGIHPAELWLVLKAGRSV